MIDAIGEFFDTVWFVGLVFSAILLRVSYVLLRNAYRKVRMAEELYPALKSLESDRHAFEEEIQAWTEECARERAAWTAQCQKDRAAIELLSREKSTGFPWLCTAIADYMAHQDERRAKHLQFKSHPARRAATHVREIARERRKAEKLWRILKYQLEYYESLFPWLTDFKDEDLDEIILRITKGETRADETESEDPVRHWLTDGEYSTLANAARNQLALERYNARKKRNWEIGREYERYVGYCMEQRGYQVRYHGIVEGLHDLGRDLIATNDSQMNVVQCKCWAKRKTIHEKHIFQLFGTVTAFRIDNPDQSVEGTFVTSTVLSKRAHQFAEKLGVTVNAEFPLQNWPSVKCNVSKRTGERIYHLPFDQQYDRTIVESERSECYTESAIEAEEMGFRRAFRWRGDQENDATPTSGGQSTLF